MQQHLFSLERLCPQSENIITMTIMYVLLVANYVGDGVCRRNGLWYQGRRHQRGLEYRSEPRGTVELFDGALKIKF